MHRQLTEGNSAGNCLRPFYRELASSRVVLHPSVPRSNLVRHLANAPRQVKRHLPLGERRQNVRHTTTSVRGRLTAKRTRVRANTSNYHRHLQRRHRPTNSNEGRHFGGETLLRLNRPLNGARHRAKLNSTIKTRPNGTLT